jgi:thiol:disulfide interchange protein DsbD
VKWAVGLIGIGIVLWLLMAKKELPGVKWDPYTTQAYEEALVAGKPVIIDFTAEWCIPCHEMERYTFTDPRVLHQASRFEMLKIDLTRSVSDEERMLKGKLKIIGVPTLVFIPPSGREAVDLRAEGFIEPDEFLERMESLAGR